MGSSSRDDVAPCCDCCRVASFVSYSCCTCKFVISDTDPNPPVPSSMPMVTSDDEEANRKRESGSQEMSTEKRLRFRTDRCLI